jgi:2-polyprenyl-3-methyl-5-hydroxy-6-metoxy-1,4-benzoquinol methylase
MGQSIRSFPPISSELSGRDARLDVRVSEVAELKEAAMPTTWDHSSQEEFIEYYSEKSFLPEQLRHFSSVRDAILRALSRNNGCLASYEILDVGCAAGGQCSVWAEQGHCVHGIDVNGSLIEIAREKAREAGQAIDYRLGSATELPWNDGSMDVCIAMELLEHIEDWRACLREVARVVKPGGALFVSTTSTLCPVQHEFNLAGYSWYPGPLKRHFERLAKTTRPALANYAKYPAVNWFDPYRLGSELKARGFSPYDRFDLVDATGKSGIAKVILSSIQSLPPLRFLAHVCTPGTYLLAIKNA